MHNRIACLLISSLPLLSGCIDNVLLADRTDGGASDAPIYTDGPTMDSPSSVCAACGGATSPDCLYAPGCGAVTRVCAANTCGDAVAIQHCGCDGRTFVSGCITPDRPYLHNGACAAVADGGQTPDAPAIDAPATDAPSLPYCPVEVDFNAGQNPDLRYRRAAFALPPGTATAPDAGTTIEVTGAWAGTRQLATPIVLGCEATDSRPECLGSTVMRVQEPGGAVQEFVVSTPAADLAALTVGLPVVLRASANRWDGAAPLRYVANLVVLRGGDNGLMFGLSTGQGVYSPLPEPTLEGDPVCRSRPEPICNRVLTAVDVSIGGTRVLPGQSAVIASSVGRFRFFNRVAYRRALTGGVECTDVTLSVFSAEVVRQPDA